MNPLLPKRADALMLAKEIGLLPFIGKPLLKAPLCAIYTSFHYVGCMDKNSKWPCRSHWNMGVAAESEYLQFPRKFPKSQNKARKISRTL